MKKNIIVRVLICLTLILFSVNTFAQEEEKTAYQERVHELAQKYYCIMHHNTENPNNLNFTDRYTMEVFTCQVYDEESYKNLMALLILAKTNEISIGQIESFKNRMTNDLKAAEKLKTTIDLKRDKEAELRKKEKEQKEKDTQTDRGYIYAMVEKQFNNWSNKGEFETREAYEKRLVIKSIYIFDSICKSQVKKYISSFKGKEYKIDTYNTELQQFPFEFEQWSTRSNLDKNKLGYLKRNGMVSVPLEKAKDFRESYMRGKSFNGGSDWFYCKYYSDNIAFLDDYIYFKKIQFVEHIFTYYDADIPLNNSQDVILFADDMKLNSPYLKGHSFNYNTYDSYWEWNNCKKYFNNFSEYISYYNKGTQVLNSEIKKKMQYAQSKEYFKDYNDFLSFYDKDEKTFKSELNYRKKVQELKQEFPASANIQEYISLYNMDYKKIDASVEYYKEMKDKYLVKYFDNKENEFYSTFLKCYVKGGGKTSFDTEIARISWYRKYKNLYSSESEFNMIFKSGKTRFQNDIDARIYVSKYYYDIRKLSDKDRKTLVTNTLYNYEHGITNTMKIVIDGDAKMKKEFESNGSYFSDTKEFFNSYIGENYKSDLKAKKKAAKDTSK